MSRYFADYSYYFITIPTIEHIPFFDSCEKKTFILNRVSKVIDEYSISDCDFSIMSFHYHFLAYLKNAQIIPKILNFINGGSAYELNKLTGNKGSVWDEYYVLVVNKDYILERVRGYVIGNPLKHKDVKNFIVLKNYPFSSYGSVVAQRGEEYAQTLVNSVIFIEEQKFIQSIKSKVKFPSPFRGDLPKGSQKPP